MNYYYVQTRDNSNCFIKAVDLHTARERAFEMGLKVVTIDEATTQQYKDIFGSI
jgi:hypothetical protein